MCYSHSLTLLLLPSLGHFSNMLTRLLPSPKPKPLPFLPLSMFLFLPLLCLPQKRSHHCLFSFSLSFTLSKWLKLICPTKEKKRKGGKGMFKILWLGLEIFMVVSSHKSQQWCAHDDHEKQRLQTKKATGCVRWYQVHIWSIFVKK